MAAIKAKKLNQEMQQARIIGLDMAAQAIAAAGQNQPKGKAAKRAGSVVEKVKVVGGVDLVKAGAECYTETAKTLAEITDHINAVKSAGNYSRATLWLYYADLLNDDANDIKAFLDGFADAATKAGSKRVKQDKSDLKLFIQAVKLNRDCALYACSLSDWNNEVLPELRLAAGREVKQSGAKKRTVKPNEKSMDKMIRYIAATDVKQLHRVWKAGMSRAAVLRKNKEMFDFFK